MKNSILKYTFFNKSITYMLVLMLSVTTAFAQTDLPDEPDDLTPATPIDDYFWLVALVGILYVFYKLRKLQRQTTTK